MTEIRYLEIIEDLSEQELIEHEPEMIRIKVADKREAQYLATQYSHLIKGDKKIQLHTHKHGISGDNQPCEVEDL